jgi:hypothetical protein
MGLAIRKSFLVCLLGRPGALFLGCATKVKTTDAANLGTVQPLTTGFLLAYKFQAEDQIVGQDGCTVILKSASDGSKIEVDVKYGKSFILAETKPGIYYFHDFQCGRYRWDMKEKTWAQFRVEKEKVSVIAPIQFKVSDARTMYTTKADRKLAYEKISAIWGLINDATKKALISGYTLKPITEDLFRNNDSWGERQVSYNGETFEKIKKSKFVGFKSCYAGEGNVNGLWLGQLKVDVDYSSTTPAISIGDDLHTFSNQFVECVKSEISGFKLEDTKIKKARLVL